MESLENIRWIFEYIHATTVLRTAPMYPESTIEEKHCPSNSTASRSRADCVSVYETSVAVPYLKRAVYSTHMEEEENLGENPHARNVRTE